MTWWEWRCTTGEVLTSLYSPENWFRYSSWQKEIVDGIINLVTQVVCNEDLADEFLYQLYLLMGICSASLKFISYLEVEKYGRISFSFVKRGKQIASNIKKTGFQNLEC